ncbi:MAG TPA: YbhB/YbcL family Raf kinase inhibitor-like protein [Burkholderiales bacterium]
MRIFSKSFMHNKKIPAEFAFCAPDAKSHATLSKNQNPHLQWQDLPPNAKSLVLICHDPDVPSKPDDVNKEGRTISAQLPRVDFFHWVLVDLPAVTVQVRPGEFSSGVKPRGKPGPESLYGSRQGLNDYTAWFASDKEMAGNYFGYDGPCPPWNDTIPHHYIFTLYAIDMLRCPVAGAFKGPEVLAAIKGHIIAQASITGLYTLNPSLKI